MTEGLVYVLATLVLFIYVGVVFYIRRGLPKKMDEKGSEKFMVTGRESVDEVR